MIDNIRSEGYDLSFDFQHVPFKFKKITCGEFVMGASDFRKDTLPQHKVKLLSDYWMLETLVTQKQWNVLRGKQMEDMLSESNFDVFNGVGDEYPIYLITWYEAVEFCNRLSKLLRPYNLEASLPTEAEWEYACRAGSYLPFSFGDSLDGRLANCNGKFPYGQYELGIWRKTATPVYTFPPNPNGLYDMHGNMWEWCLDWYSETYYTDSPLCDPCGPLEGCKKVIRGGGWRSRAECCRSAFRDSDPPNYRGRSLSFRIIIKQKFKKHELSE